MKPEVKIKKSLIALFVTCLLRQINGERRHRITYDGHTPSE